MPMFTPAAPPDSLATQSSAGPSAAITIADQNTHVLTLTGAHGTASTITAGSYVGRQFTLVVKQDGTGARVFTWPTSVIFAAESNLAGTGPATTSAAAGSYVAISLRWDGTNWIEVARGGSLAGNYSGLGDLELGGAVTGQPIRMAAGVNGAVLTSTTNNVFTGANWLRPPQHSDGLGPTGTVAQTMPRWAAHVDTVAALGTGIMRMTAIYLQEGQVVTNIVVMAGATAGATMTHSNVALYSSALAFLRSSTDQTTATWTAQTSRTWILSATVGGAASAYTVPAGASGWYYIGFVWTGTTGPSFYGNSPTGIAMNGVAPISSGSSTTGLTTAIPPAPAGALTALGPTPWMYCT